jgi:hypothetical protein
MEARSFLFAQGSGKMANALFGKSETAPLISDTDLLCHGGARVSVMSKRFF